MENINERRLRPVFDNLELGNHKKAIQEADKVLKKTPNIQCARALKALALLRIGKPEDAEPLILALCTEKPCDVSTLQVMTFYYRETEEHNKICTLYSNAVSVCPGNEELMSHLFMSYVRINDYKQQQTAAMQLYKFRPKNPYYFWAVMSVVLQALQGPDAGNKEKANVLLALAQRMVDKLIKEDKLDAEQEVDLYLNILKQQGKYEEALKFLDSELCMRLYPGAPVSINIELLKLLKRWVELNALLEKLLQDEHDRWDYYLEYIATAFELEAIGEKKDGQSFIETVSDFIKQIIEVDPKVRGPRLAQMELHRLMCEKDMNATELLGDYTNLLFTYYCIFGDRICCTYDLKKFLEFMEAHKRPGFASKLLQECSATPLPENKNSMQRHICALQISRICGAHAALTTEHLQALYTTLSLHYEHGFNAFGADMLPTDIGPSDPYALLAVNVMYDLSLRTQTSERLVEAVCVLSNLLTNSPSNFHAKLLSLQLHHILGCASGAHQIYQSLDVKQIQLDSMGYLHCAHLAGTGLPSIARQMYDGALKFFNQSQKDTLEYLSMCYKFGSFSKLQEFMRFRERLWNSYHAALVVVESQLLDIVTMNGTVAQNSIVYKNLGLKPDDDRIAWNDLSDNRDLSVVGRWDPAFPYANEAGVVIEPETMTTKLREMEKENFMQDIELLQIRSGLVRLVGAMYDLVTSDAATHANKPESAKEKLQYNLKILTILKNYWHDLFVRIGKMNYQPTSNAFLVNLIPSRLHMMLQLPLESYFTQLADFILKIYKGDMGSKDAAAQVIEKIHEIVQLLTTTIATHNESQDLIWNRRNVQGTIAGLLEILSLSTFILSVTHERYMSSQQNQNKKGKKKDAKQNGVLESDLTDSERFTIVLDVVRELKKSLAECDSALDTWKPPVVNKSLTETLAAMSLNANIESTVMTTFKENHIAVVRELKQIVKDKIKMVNK